SRGVAMLCDTVTNQIFPVLPNGDLQTLNKRFNFAFWASADDGHTAVRVCTGATTPDANVEMLIAAVEALPEPPPFC
ncbi:MAG: hypothetical protein LLF96_07505, partial [Eubacteriales bacterium]|nr:hypothetical protein [Eubacteriales bacterium]